MGKDCRHPCKSLVKKKHEFSGRAQESALFVRSGSTAAHMCLSAGGSCTSQNRTSICSLRLRRAVTEDWVGVLCQSRNNSERASGVWSPSHSRQRAGPGSLRIEWSWCLSFPV